MGNPTHTFLVPLLPPLPQALIKVLGAALHSLTMYRLRACQSSRRRALFHPGGSIFAISPNQSIIGSVLKCSLGYSDGMYEAVVELMYVDVGNE